jgi:hypothetical protein
MGGYYYKQFWEELIACFPVGRVNCCWHSQAQPILVSGAVGTHDHTYVLSKTFTCFEMGPPLRRGKWSHYYVPTNPTFRTDCRYNNLVQLCLTTNFRNFYSEIQASELFFFFSSVMSDCILQRSGPHDMQH